MLKLAFKLLWKRKYFVAAIIGIISISSMLTIFASMTATSIYEQKKERAIKTYGSFICGASELTADDIDKLDKHNNIKKGFFELYRNVELGDSIFTAGYGDATFLDMANAVLEEGRMPAASGEVAMERFVAEAYEVSAPGEKIEITITGAAADVQVVGIVRNYSNQLSVHYQLEKGINNYPNIFSSSESNFYRGAAETAQSVLLGFKSTDSIDPDQMATLFKMYQEIEIMGLTSTTIYDNDNLFIHGLVYCKEINYLSYIFAGIIIFATVFCSWSLLRLFYREYGGKLAVLGLAGMRKKQLLGVVGIQFLFFIVLSSCAGLAGGMLINYFLGNILFPGIENSIDRSSFVFLGSWFIVFYLCLGVLYYNIIRSVYNTSIHQLLQSWMLSFRTKGVRRNLNYNILKRMKWAKAENVLLFTFLFCTGFIILYSYNIATDNYDDIPDYQLFSKILMEQEVIAGYEIEYNHESYISAEAVTRLEETGANIYIDSVPNVNSNTLLLNAQQMSPYFKRWTANYAQENAQYEASIVRAQWPEEADTMTPVPNVAFIIANEQQVKLICKEYNLDADGSDTLDGSKILMFLPESLNNEEIGISKETTLALGGIIFQDQSVVFHSQDVKVKEIIRAPYQLTVNGHKQERDELTIVVSEKFAAESEFFRGYKALSVYLGSDLSEKEKTAIDNCIHSIQSGVQGGIMYSKKATQEAELLYASYIRVLGISMMVIVVLFSGIFVYAQIYNALRENEKKYGIMRVMGASVDLLSHNIFMGYINSMLLSFAIDILVIIVFFRQLLVSVQSFGYMFVSFIMVFLMASVSAFLPRRFFEKTRIQQMISGGLEK